MGITSFLDSKNMKPGDNLDHHIDKGIIGCKIGVAVFSPQYCDSKFCLHELALLMETKKRDNVTCSEKELRRFRFALAQAKNTVGLTFDSFNGDWSELLKDTTNAVVMNLWEVGRKNE
ncbi:unnamed protein product [Vicia faba]|uniref:TIR domain-containing protein n=1 Tax=Vicia faba TaxID=3906 RepID=A0AAV0YGQ1_VICFA|nr:unnamed protein product [Vicia faba]